MASTSAAVPASGPAAVVLPTHGPWTQKQIAAGITSLPEDLASPRHLAIYARNH